MKLEDVPIGSYFLYKTSLQYYLRLSMFRVISRRNLFVVKKDYNLYVIDHTTYANGNINIRRSLVYYSNALSNSDLDWEVELCKDICI
jgi:hypothetical protein